jgi:WD40 repeat protein
MKVRSVPLLTLLCLVGIALSSVVATAPRPTLPPLALRKDSLGDPLPRGAVARFGTRRLCNPSKDGFTTGVLFTPNGKQLITATSLLEDEDPSWAVQVWDLATGAPLGNFGRHQRGVVAMALSRDGTRLVTAGYYGSIDVWDPRTRKHLRRLRSRSGVRPQIALCADGTTLVCSNPGIQIWDLKTGKKLNEFNPPGWGGYGLAVSPDGKLITVSSYSGKTITVVATATGKRLYAVPSVSPASATFSPDDATLAVEGPRGQVCLHDAASGKLLRAWQVWSAQDDLQRYGPLAYSPDGTMLVTGNREGSGALWDPRDGKLLRRLPAQMLFHVAFSPDGKLVGGWDLYRGRVTVWNAATGKPHFNLPGHSRLVTSVTTFAGEDRFASSGGEGFVLVWDRRKPYPVASYAVTGGNPRALSSVGADLFAFGDWQTDQVPVWRLGQSKPLAVFKPEQFLWATCLSPDGKLLACGDNEAGIHIFPLGGAGPVRRLTIPLKGKPLLDCKDVAFSLDGKQLAVACSDGALRLCDVASARWTETLDGGVGFTPDGFVAHLAAVAYDPTGLLLAARGRDKLIFWDVRGELVRRFDVPDHWRYDVRWSVRFSPDGRYLASSEGDKVAKLWEVRSGEVVGLFRGHERAVIGVGFLAGGRQVVTASHDNTLLLWDRALMHADRRLKEGLNTAWDDLIGSAEQAHHRIWQMTQLPEAEVFLAKRLPPITRTKDSPRPEQVERWIADLSSESAVVREAARKQLQKNLDFAEGALLHATKSVPSPRAESVLKELRAQVFRNRQSPERRRADRALAVLEYRGTDGAKKVLKGIAAGAAGHWRTQEAEAALHRLGSSSNGGSGR